MEKDLSKVNLNSYSKQVFFIDKIICLILADIAEKKSGLPYFFIINFFCAAENFEISR